MIQTRVRDFDLETVVGLDNAALQKIAATVISDQLQETTDSVSSLLALKYLARVR